MENKRKRFIDNFRLRNISDLDVVLVGIAGMIWFVIIRAFNPKIEDYQSQTVQETSPFISILLLIFFVSYLLLIGLRIGYKRGKKQLLEDLRKEGKLKQ
ncbi:MAG: hypothetical protein ACW990_00180 [Promethearchaeota archaeon]|jgi:hypothetical protein